MLGYLTNFLLWGISANNLNRPTIGTQKDKLPQVYRTGFSYHPENDLNFVIDAEKDSRYPLTIKAGLEYNLYGMIDGLSSEPTKFSGENRI